MNEVKVNFSVLKSEILYKESVSHLSGGDEQQYMDYMAHHNSKEKNLENSATYFRGFRFLDENTPTVDIIQDSGDVPLGFALKRTANAFYEKLKTSFIVNTPLAFIFLPEGRSLNDYTCLSFLKHVPREEDFLLIDFEQGESSEHKVPINTSEVSWNINGFDMSMIPRVFMGGIYIERGDYFILDGSFIPTKFLSAEYFDFCVNTIMKVFPLFRREVAQDFVERSFYATDEIWKYYYKENKWELILPPTPLSYMKTLGGRGCSMFRNHMLNPRRILEARKLYFVSAPRQNTEPTTRLIALFSLEYTSNKYERVEEFDKISYKFKYYTKLYVVCDNSNDTMIFISNEIKSILIICLQTFNYIEIAIEAKLPPEYLDYCWRQIICEKQRKLAIVSYSNNETPLGSGKEGVQLTDIIGLVDWESIKSQKIDPFLQIHRKKTLFQNVKSIFI